MLILLYQRLYWRWDFRW